MYGQPTQNAAAAIGHPSVSDQQIVFDAVREKCQRDRWP
jgi:hypothetical protein